MSNFREFDRETRFLLPPSLDEWLPEQHLARFVVEVIDGLDLSAMVKRVKRSISSARYWPPPRCTDRPQLMIQGETRARWDFRACS